MKHAAFFLLAAASFMIAIATVVLWVRSYHVGDQFTFSERSGDFQFIRARSGTFNLRATYQVHVIPKQRPVVTFSHTEEAYYRWGTLDLTKTYPTNAYHYAWKLWPFSFAKAIRLPAGSQLDKEIVNHQYEKAEANLHKLLAAIGTMKPSATQLKELQLANTQMDMARGSAITAETIESAMMIAKFHGWMWEFDFPAWFLFAVTLLLPALWCYRFFHNSRRYRRKHGLCQVCGYDLRASPDRCPECGTPVRPNFLASNNQSFR